VDPNEEGILGLHRSGPRRRSPSEIPEGSSILPPSASPTIGPPMGSMIRMSFDKPEEVRPFESSSGKVELA
jgi:hypothetical protein